MNAITRSYRSLKKVLSLWVSAMLSLSSSKKWSKGYSSICVNDDVAWVQRWSGLLLPQIIAAFPMPFAVSVAMFSINSYVATICVFASIFSTLALISALADVRVLWRCLCVFLTYLITGVAIISTVSVSYTHLRAHET